MAILERNGALRGTAGTVVFRRFRDKTVVQSLPRRKKKQTLASQASAGEFGLASTTASAVRLALGPVFRNRHDGAMVNRFNSAVYHSILGSRTAERGTRDLHDGDLGCLEGFEFHAGSPLKEALKVKPVVSLTDQGRIRIRMGSLNSITDLKVPEKIREMTDSYRLRFLATAFNFRCEYYEYVGVKDLTVIKWKELEAQDFELEGTVPEGCVVMVTVSLECLTTNLMDGSTELVNTVSFSPAAIMAVFRSGEAPAMEAWKPNVRRNGRHPVLYGYAGNELLTNMAMLRKKTSAGKSPGKGTSRNGPNADKPREREEEASFIFGRRFSF